MEEKKKESLDSEQLQKKLMAYAVLLNYEAVTANLENRYAELGQEVEIPDFTAVVDSFKSRSVFEKHLEFEFRDCTV